MDTPIFTNYDIKWVFLWSAGGLVLHKNSFYYVVRVSKPESFELKILPGSDLIKVLNDYFDRTGSSDYHWDSEEFRSLLKDLPVFAYLFMD